MPKRFTGACSFAASDLKVITYQRRPVKTIVDAPQSAGLAWFLHNSRIDQTQHWLARRRTLEAALGKEATTELVQPILALAQSLEQGHIREVGYWPLSPGPRFLASNSHSPNARATPSKDFPPTYLDAIPSKRCSGELASSNPMEKTITVDPSPRRLHCFQACTVFIENLC